MLLLGYPGLFLLMTAESMVFPVPSEAVMPYAGYLIATGATSWHGTWDWPGAILVSSLGSIAGSYLSYLMGAYGLLPLVERYGKYVLIHKHHIDSAHRWFERRGAWAIFICRFIPGVRHVISIPAGSARMPLRPFLFATFVGATMWNVFLLWIGWQYGVAAAEAVKPYLDVVGIGLLAAILAYVAFEVLRARRHRKPAPMDEPQD